MDRTIKKTRAVTLIELLIAISLLALVLLAGSGIYLSGWKMFRNGQLMAQAQRNAIIPMMEITKNLQRGTSLSGGAGPATTPTLTFTIDDNGTPADLTDDDTIVYSFVLPNITGTRTAPLGVSSTFFTAGFISACTFTYTNTNPTVTMNITATESVTNNPTQSYVLNSTAELRCRRGGA